MRHRGGGCAPLRHGRRTARCAVCSLFRVRWQNHIFHRWPPKPAPPPRQAHATTSLGPLVGLWCSGSNGLTPAVLTRLAAASDWAGARKSLNLRRGPGHLERSLPLGRRRHVAGTVAR